MRIQRVEQSARGRFSVSTWTGDRARLARVFTICESLASWATDELTRRHADDREARKAAFLSRAGFANSEELFAERDDADLKVQLANLEPRLTTTERQFKRKLSGNLEDVMEQVEIDDVIRATITVGQPYSSYSSGGFALQVDFVRDAGCSVEAQAPSSDWVVLVEGQLRPALMQGRPWYWILRNKWAAAVYGVPFIVGLIALMSGLAKEPITASEWWVYSFAISPVSIWAGYGILTLARRLLPAFEVIDAGGKARGTRILGVAGGALLWVGGIAIPPLLHAAG